jgi:ubiquinone/menaquinone biosynthesis C-methylase UbiE
VQEQRDRLHRVEEKRSQRIDKSDSLLRRKEIMPYSLEKLLEHPSAYIVQDRENQEDMTRLAIQDEMVTIGMGGVLPELADPMSLRRVLDVGCGTGGWLMEVARTYPMIEFLVGADISSAMLSHTCAQAKAQFLDGRVQFKTMDALRMLQFSGASFDLVNQRFGATWLRQWEWKKILLEYHRVTRAGGIIRLTEANIPESNSPALTELHTLLLKAFHHSGRFFTATSDGITSELVQLMTQHAIENVQSQVHTLVFRAGTLACQHFCQDMKLGFRLFLPFLNSWTRVPSDYQQTYQRALKEMEQPDFVATWTLITAYGTKSLYGEPLLMRGLR